MTTMSLITDFIKISAVFIILASLQRARASPNYALKCYGVSESNAKLFVRLYMRAIESCLKSYYPGYIFTKFNLKTYIEPATAGLYTAFIRTNNCDSIFTPKEFVHFNILTKEISIKDENVLDSKKILGDFISLMVTYSKNNELEMIEKQTNAGNNTPPYRPYGQGDPEIFTKMIGQVEYFTFQYERFLFHYKNDLKMYYINVTMMHLSPALETKFYTSQILFYYHLYNSYENERIISPGAFLELLISYGEKRTEFSTWDDIMRYVITKEVVEKKVNYVRKKLPNDEYDDIKPGDYSGLPPIEMDLFPR